MEAVEGTKALALRQIIIHTSNSYCRSTETLNGENGRKKETQRLCKSLKARELGVTNT